MKICTKCGEIYDDEKIFCTEDGKVLLEIAISPTITADFLQELSKEYEIQSPTPPQFDEN